jgi:hypothetical protein
MPCSRPRAHGHRRAVDAVVDSRLLERIIARVCPGEWNYPYNALTACLPHILVAELALSLRSQHRPRALSQTSPQQWSTVIYPVYARGAHRQRSLR